ncbi:MAG: CoA transferase, partial [Candidatus Methanomethylicaceae archaeon]
SFNAGKKSITLDIEKERGKEIFRKLVQRTDFLLESYEPGYLQKLGLAYEDLKILNPSLIMVSITPFGSSGPFARFKADDLVIQALGAILSQQGDADRPPVRTSFVPQAYMHAGADAAEAALIAHYYRTRTSLGQHVDVSIMESVLWVAGRDLAFFNAFGTSYKREGPFWTRPKRGTVRSIWECKEGYVAFAIQGGQTGAPTNRALVEWMELKGLAPEFMKEKDWEKWDFENVTQEELDMICEAIGKFFKTMTADEIESEASKKGLLINKVCSVKDHLTNDHLRARGFWREIEYEELGRSLTYPGGFAKFSLTPVGPTHRAPKIGEHNWEVYTQLGITEEEMGELKSWGII